MHAAKLQDSSTILACNVGGGGEKQTFFRLTACETVINGYQSVYR